VTWVTAVAIACAMGTSISLFFSNATMIV
ncbi:unnamed protein product, partial [Adineta ricciae]